MNMYPVFTDRQLIDGSLKKWRRVLASQDHNTEKGNADCPLCQVYWESHVAPRCTGCPIRTKTGQPMCVGTPYEDWIAALDAVTDYALYESYDDVPKWSDELEVAAKDMIKFLLQLRQDYPE